MGKRILVAPLNWGIGHATRCIPIIDALKTQGFEPILASDGQALALLKKEFPELQSFELPSYKVQYPKNGKHFKRHMLLLLPKFLKAIRSERKHVAHLVKQEHIAGIISDNRLGVYHPDIPSIYMTHQLQVLSGATTWLSTKLHQHFIAKFDACWVPDNASQVKLSGILSDQSTLSIPVRYLGIVSRFNKQTLDKTYDLLVLLSGPEPQRHLLETLLLKELTAYNGSVLCVRGVIEDQQTRRIKGNIDIVNYMTSEELEKVLNKSELVLARSGYSTILDLAKLGKNAFFIPTPGQYEQHYLAEHLEAASVAPFCEQHDFTLDQLERVDHYHGFENMEYQLDFSDLFSLFKSE